MADDRQIDLVSDIASMISSLGSEVINKNNSKVNMDVNIKQTVTGTKDVKDATKAINDYKKSLKDIPKTDLSALKRYKSSNKQEALDKINMVNIKQKPGDLVSFVNAYKAQFDDWDDITEEMFKGITRIRQAYDELSKQTNNDGQLKYGLRNSVESFKELFSKYADMEHITFSLKYDINFDDESIIKEFKDRKEALINKLLQLDKGKGVDPFGAEFENIIGDSQSTKEFATYYSELERIIEIYGGDIPERIREMYNAIEKENVDGGLRIASAMQKGSNNFDKMLKQLREYGFSDDSSFIDDFKESEANIKKLDQLRKKAIAITDDIDKAQLENISKNGDKDYYTNRISALDHYIESLKETKEKLLKLSEENMSEESLASINKTIAMLNGFENIAYEKLIEISDIYDKIKDTLREGQNSTEDIYNSENYGSSGFGNDIDLGGGSNGFDDEKAKESIQDITKIIELLNRLVEEIHSVSIAIGTVDEESGISNLITQFDGLIQKISELQEAVGRINFNVVINDPSKDEDFWKKQLQRYRDYFQKAVKTLGGMDFAYNAIDQSSFVGDFTDIAKRFNQEAMDNSNLKPEQIVQNYQEFFKYLKEAAKMMREDTDNFSMAVKESVKNLPTSDVKALIRNNKRAQAKEGAGDKADAITQAINDALTGNKDKEDIDISKHLGDLTGVIEDLKKIQELLNQIAENKAIAENVDRITAKLDSMQQSFRDLLRNLNESVKSNQVNLEMGDGNVEITAAQKAEEASENINKLIEHLEKLNNEISEIRKSLGAVDSEGGIAPLLSQFTELSNKIDNIQSQLSTGILSSLNSQSSIEAKFGDLSSITETIKEIKAAFDSMEQNTALSELIDSIIVKLDSMKQSFKDLIHNLKDAVDNISLSKNSKIAEGIDESDEQKLLTLMTKLKDMVSEIEIMPSIPHPKDFINRIDELLYGYFASVDIKPNFIPGNFISDVNNMIEDEISSFSRLAEYLSQTVPEAVEIKNKAFRDEVDVVSKAVNDEITEIKKLEKELTKKTKSSSRKKNTVAKENIVEEASKASFPLLSGDDALVQFCEGLDKTTAKANMTKKSLEELYASSRKLNDASSSLDLLSELQESEAPRKAAEAISEEIDSVEKAEKAFDKTAEKKEKFTKSNKEAAASAQKTSEKAKEEASSINNVSEQAEKASASVDGYIRSQIGDAKSGNYSYTQALSRVVDKKVTHTEDTDGNVNVVEQLRINYDKLTKALIKDDTTILKLQNQILQADANEQVRLTKNLNIVQARVQEYEHLLDLMIADDTYAISDSQKQILDAQRKINKEYVKNQNELDNIKVSKAQANKENEKTLQYYNKLNKQVLEYVELRQKLQSGGSGSLSNYEVQRLNELNKAFQEVNANINNYAVNSIGTSRNTEKLIKLQKELQAIYNSNNSETLKQLGIDERNKILKSTKSYTKLNPDDYDSSTKSKLLDLQNLIRKINSEGLDLNESDDIDKLIRINSLVEELRGNLKKIKPASELQIKEIQSEIRSFQNNNTAMGAAFREKFDSLYNQLGVAKTDNEVKSLIGRFHELKGEVNKAGKTGNNLFTDLAKQIRSANAQFLRMYFSWMDWVRYIRTAFNTLKELDNALLDLKKTTTMNNSDLEEFYSNSNKIAKETGVTTQEIITQAAAWSRLGFSSKEAVESMSQLSSQFAKISPGTTVENATDYLVSTMKAFHIDVADVESEIMDVINRIGNTMSTSNQEVGEMLKRSSAAMAEANNSLAETIALESAAVQITRNAETTGTAFRTISMRIRGLNEETEEALENYEELKGKVADLTKTAKTPGGISLFTDESKSTYKSTYQLLKEIASIYHDLTDKQQAELLETLAGKRGGQVLAGLLSDFTEVERAMKEIEQSAGSADKEMSIVAETLDYKLNNLKQTWVGIVTDLGDRKVLGNLIDALAKISELIDKIVSNKVGLGIALSTIIGGITTARGTGATILRDKNNNWGGINLFGLAQLANKQTRTDLNIFSANDVKLTKQYVDELQKLGKTKFDTATWKNTMAGASKECQTFVKNGIKANMTAAQMADQMKSTSIAINGTAIAQAALNIALTAGITLIISGAISLATKLYSDWAHQVSNTADAANKLRDAFNNTKQEAEDNLKTFDSLSKRFEELSKGVDNLGHNVYLTDEEFKEYQDIVKNVADMSPNLVQGYNDQNEAIINIRGNVQGLREDYIEAQKAAYDMIITGNPKDKESGNINTLINEYLNTYKKGDYQFLQGHDLGPQQAITMLKHIRDEAHYYDFQKGPYDAFSNIEEAAREYGISAKSLQRFIKESFNVSYSEIDKSTFESMKDLANTYIISYEQSIEEALNNFKQVFEALLKRTDSEYYNLGQISQEIVSTIINNIDKETAKDLAEQGSLEIEEWIKSQIEIAKTLPEDIQAVMNKSLTGTGIDNTSELKENFNEIINYLTNDPNGPKLQEGDDGYTWVIYFETKIKDANLDIERVRKRLFKNYTGDSTLKGYLEGDYDKWLEGKSEDFKNWAENILTIPDNTFYSMKELDELYADYLEKVEKYSDVELLDTKDTVKSINSELKPALESVKSIYTSLFETPTKLNLNALNKNDLTGQLESVRSQFEALGENLKVSVDYTAFDNLANVLENTDSTAEEVKEALDQVVSSFIDLAINGKESDQTVIALLRNMGILLPEMSYYNELLKDSNTIYTKLKEVGIDWSEVTINENGRLVDSTGAVIDAENSALSMWIKSIVGTENYKVALDKLRASKILLNDNWINSDKDIQNLINLAKATGKSTSALVRFSQIKSEIKAIESGNKYVPSSVLEQLHKESDELQKEIETEFSGISDNTIEIELPDIAFVGKDLGKAVKDFNTEAKPIFDSIKDTYESIFNGDEGFDINVVTPEMLEGIRNQFGELAKYFKDTFGIEDAFDVDALEKFLSVLSDGTTTAKQAQEAFNEYVTSLFYSADGLKNVSEETADAMKQMLEKSGVVNYEEVVDYMLNLQAAEEYVAQTSLDLANIKSEEIKQLVLEGTVAESTAQGIAVLALQEQLVNAERINCSDSIASLYALAQQAGLSAEYLVRLEEVMRLFDAADLAYSKDTNTATHEMAKAAEATAIRARDQLFKEIQEKLGKTVELDIEMPKVDSGGGSAADQGKSDADAYADAYNKELEALKWLKDQNYLTEAEYLEKFRELYQRYYGDLSKYAKEYYEAEKEYYEQKIALQQKAINAVIRLLDRQIKEQEKLRDAEKKEYEEQKKNNEKKIKELEKIIKKYDKQIKQLQKEQKLIRKQNIEPLEEQIKSRQKVIDSLNEEIELMERANEARQDEINLQKAQYELERARHQRTQLVYTEDTGFGQMRYRANPDSVKDAQEAYDNAVYEHRLKIKRDEIQAVQDEIDKYQKEIDKYNEQIELIDKKIEKLEDEKEIVQEKIEKYQEENEKLDEIIEKIDERYQKEIDRIEEYKQKWQELLEIQEQIEDLEVLSSLDLDISSLINLDPSVFDNFKDKYTETLSHLYDANQHYADAFNDALDKGLELNTDKMRGLEDAAKKLQETLSDVDGSGSGGGSSGSGGGGLRLRDTPKVLDDTKREAEEAGETVNNQFENTDKKLLLLEKRTQDDFARSKLGFNDIKDITEQIDKVLGTSAEKMERAAKASKEVADNLKDASQQKLPSVSGNSVSGNSVSGNSITGNTDYNGTVGNAFASGYSGLKHSEVALRSEYGQPELTVYPNGKYELTTEPTMSKLPKDTVIFNEEQTKRILKNGKKGNSFAEGTGLKSLEEVMPDKAELFSKFEANLSNNMSTIQSSLDIISRNTAEINSNLASKITNNNVGMSYVNNGDINITCPGVTSQEVLDSITEQLNSTFFGMANNSYQRAMKRG